LLRRLWSSGNLRGPKDASKIAALRRGDARDMREAPSLSLIVGLQDLGAVVRAYDPLAWNKLG